jgi:hypothetical protein
MYTSLLLLSLVPLAQEDADLFTGVLPRPPQTVEFDAPDHALRLRAPSQVLTPGAPAWDAPESPESIEASRLIGTQKTGAGPAPQMSSALSIRELMTEVLVTEPGDGRVWVRGRDYRASFGTEGFTFLPVFGKASPQEFPVGFSVRRATVGEASLALGVDDVQQGDGRVTMTHPSLREVYHLDLDGIEQTFVFDSLPASGELVVDLAVGSELAVLDRADGLFFVHPTLGHVSYGDAFVLDAAGARASIARTWTGDGIQLRVPAEFLADAVLPLTIDPRVTAFSSSFGAQDDDRPDTCYDGGQDVYWVVWEEYTSATNSDCYLTSFTNGGTQGSSFAVDTTSDSWLTPKVAYHYGANRLLVVAQEDAAGNGTVQGQLVNASTRALIGGQITISTCCFRKLHPDVGGSSWDSVSNNYFCVVWAFENSTSDRDVQYRLVDWDGTFVTAVTEAEGTTDDTIHTTVSQTMGDVLLPGDYWTIAWTNTPTGSFGTINARRVAWNGATTSGAGNFVVDSNTNCSWPTVTSRLDDNLATEADRPSIIAFERDFATASGTPARQRNIYARVITDGLTFVSNSISSVMEDVDPELDQRSPHIATDGNAWYLAYEEVWFGNPAGSDRDIYYCAGHVSDSSTNAYVALAERHQNLAFDTTAERFPRVATVWDGEPASISDDAAIVWVDYTGSGVGRLEGYTVDIPTVDASANIAVGRQFCDANDNGGSAVNGADSSWMWIEGTQSLNNTHIARCENVTPNAAGYLITSMSTTNVNMAGGGLGRLCVAGAGRYVNAVQNSGAGRTYSTNINPLNLPSPIGFVSAAPGQTWHFQYWHRDTSGGGATQNFSNACSVTFNP